MTITPLGQVYTFVEMFAGSGNASRTANWAGHAVASVDILYWESFTRRAGKRSRSHHHDKTILKIGDNPLDVQTKLFLFMRLEGDRMPQEDVRGGLLSPGRKQCGSKLL